MSENKKNLPIVPITISTVCLIIGLVVGFFVGKSRTPSFPGRGQMSANIQNRTGSNGAQRGSGSNFQNGFKQVMGEISKIDDSSITVKTPDGGSKIILISSSTTFNKATETTKSDLQVGTNISVSGDNNSDGSVTGKTINIVNIQNPNISPSVTVAPQK